MASGGAFERDGRQWVARPVTRGHVWGPCRAYRWECLQDVLPLEERMGWDGVDELKAGALGWRTGVVPDLWFWHHRLQGRRDGARRRHWQALGDSAHFMHYRFSYLVLRALYRARGEPVAIAMIWGYLSAVLRRQQQCSDSSVREVVRRQQSFRRLPLRVLDALRRRTPGRRPPATPELRRSSSV
jgi:hypothetical protein